ncbi:jg6736 [Pararge aegeria aegeria]|uniref:Jg6736 protein n=1 Tax=Pararge aegeria aegeria TaxID=348720 RepID=A0A8S4R354_9NEOP|nr:jg6736 [Pararge aegeria aegeria]
MDFRAPRCWNGYSVSANAAVDGRRQAIPWKPLEPNDQGPWILELPTKALQQLTSIGSSDDEEDGFKLKCFLFKDL